MDPHAARTKFSVVGERTLLELRGVACIGLKTVGSQRKGIAVTRSFKRQVISLEGLHEAVASYSFRAAEKL